MNWDEVDFDWNQARAFMATAEEGSFSGAARALKTTQPTITRQISALEKSLQVMLFERSNRGLKLTSAGQHLLSHVLDMGAAASRVSMSAQNYATDIEGEVSVTAADFMCTYYVIEAVKQLKVSAPKISVRVLPSDQVQDIKYRDADIAIRHVPTTEPDLIAKKIGDWSANFYAARGYLDRLGRAKQYKDLERFEFVGPQDPTAFIEMCRAKGLDLKREQFTYPCSSTLLAFEMVRRGVGAGVLADAIAKNDPEMEMLWPDSPPHIFPVWLVTHQELRKAQKIRAVFDALERVLRAVPDV